MRNYRRWNDLIGWIVWAVATFVYVATAERTVSWWDCGEYISTSGKLMVGHPPGAPTFQLIGCIAQIFTFGHTEYAAFAVNVMSALCSSFTILFLFWSITLIARKLALRSVSGETGTLDRTRQWTVLACGAVGALAYTFSDSFWFSSAEGEVYAMSSFFTALSFWAILRWEEAADRPYHSRWILLIAFLVGLAIGVHLLNLLVLPAMVFTVYYKKFPRTAKGFWVSLLLSVALLAVLLWGVIPWTLKLAGYFEIFFVNTLHLPFDSGTIVYFVLLATLLAVGLYLARRKGRTILHTALLSLVFLLIGYSTFLTLVIRANAGVPINENEPKDALSLLSYLNREHYGSRPLLYGPYFNARITGVEEVSTQYAKNRASGRYEVVGHNMKYIYDREHCGLFPRMYSQEQSGARPHVAYYRFWSGTDAAAGTEKPTAVENTRFLLRYHLGWMYFRYFMWNFAGRQNNIQGLGYHPDGSRDVFHGNWISGIKPLDAWRLGPQDDLPDYLRNNQGRNTFFLLPLLLGFCGLFYQYRKAYSDFWIVFLLFFMTGIAIVLYLNQPSTEPRERDYAYAGSFYAFAIWIGLGVMALTDWLARRFSRRFVSGAVTLSSLLFVPGLMAQQGWDDHDRSHRTAAYDFARNTLFSCDADGVLVTNGDNDTFPLWYCQEMEGIRTDVRILNSSLAGSYWHIQPLYRQVYRSAPFSLTLPYEAQGRGVNDYVLLGDADLGDHVELSDILAFVASGNPATKQRMQDGSMVGVFPTRRAKVSLDTFAVARIACRDSVPESSVASEIRMNVKPGAQTLSRAELAFLDLFGTGKFERPIHFMSQDAQASVLPVKEWGQMQGGVYKLVPYRNANRIAVGGNGMDVGRTYDWFVHRFRWGNLQDPRTSVDPESAGYAGMIRYQYILLARTLNFENRHDSAVEVLDKSLEFFPHRKVPYEAVMVLHVEEYFRAGAEEKGMGLAKELTDMYASRLDYVGRFLSRFRRSADYERRQCCGALFELSQRMSAYSDRADVAALIQEINQKIKENEL